MRNTRKQAGKTAAAPFRVFSVFRGFRLSSFLAAQRNAKIDNRGICEIRGSRQEKPLQPPSACSACFAVSAFLHSSLHSQHRGIYANGRSKILPKNQNFSV